MLADAVFYSEPRIYDIVPQQPCPMERAGSTYTSPRLNSWRPIRGYENVESLPPPSQPVTDALVEPCYVPSGMVTKSMRFPSRISGVQRNPANAAHAALNPRYTNYEWDQHNIFQNNEYSTVQSYCERLGEDTVRVLRQTDEITAKEQWETKQRLGERIFALSFYKNEAAAMLNCIVQETNRLQDKRRDIQVALQDLEGILHISQECLGQREQRMGIDLVHDGAERALLKEVELLRASEIRLSCLDQTAIVQINNNRATQHDIEMDVMSKEAVISMDKNCQDLHNFSRGLEYHGGIEKYAMTTTTHETWAENSHKTIQRAHVEHSKSMQLRCDIDGVISSCACDVREAWEETNKALSNLKQTAEEKMKTEQQFHQVQQEQFAIEKYIILLRKALDDKTNPLKVTHTLIETRSHRINIENCYDPAHSSMLQEVQDIRCSIDMLHRQLQECEAHLQQLIKTKSSLEMSLQIKANTLFIDQEKCLSMRRSYPILCMIKH